MLLYFVFAFPGVYTWLDFVVWTGYPGYTSRINEYRNRMFQTSIPLVSLEIMYRMYNSHGHILLDSVLYLIKWVMHSTWQYI